MRRTVWFSDELTPRLEWTWGTNFFASAAIRTYCWRRCTCRLNPDPEDILFNNKVWHIIGDKYILENGDGSMTLSDSKSRTSSTRILAPQQGGARASPRAGRCGVDRRQFCQVPWPVDLVGSEVPRAPPDITQVVKDPSTPQRFSECGMHCNGPQDCSNSVEESDPGCFRGIPSPRDSRVLGFDPIVPVPVCLVLAHVVTNGFNGRDNVIRYIDEPGLPYQCPYNTTFVSERCCGVRDGMIDIA